MKGPNDIGFGEFLTDIGSQYYCTILIGAAEGLSSRPQLLGSR